MFCGRVSLTCREGSGMLSSADATCMHAAAISCGSKWMPGRLQCVRIEHVNYSRSAQGACPALLPFLEPQNDLQRGRSNDSLRMEKEAADSIGVASKALR